MLPVLLAVRVRGLGVGRERVLAVVAGLGRTGAGRAHGVSVCLCGGRRSAVALGGTPLRSLDHMRDRGRNVGSVLAD